MDHHSMLELNIFSAHDLKKITLFGEMQTYIVAWINSDNKISMEIDRAGGSNPKWNDKLILSVEDGFLHSETSSVTIQIYCIGRLKDRLVGTTTAMLCNLLKRNGGHTSMWMSFCVLQLKLLSGRPQGILNLGAIILEEDSQLHG
ncbi:hypothetical protein KI387_003548, partial [Taxus chinensis]